MKSMDVAPGGSSDSRCMDLFWCDKEVRKSEQHNNSNIGKIPLNHVFRRKVDRTDSPWTWVFWGLWVLRPSSVKKKKKHEWESDIKQPQTEAVEVNVRATRIPVCRFPAHLVRSRTRHLFLFEPRRRQQTHPEKKKKRKCHKLNEYHRKRTNCMVGAWLNVHRRPAEGSGGWIRPLHFVRRRCWTCAGGEEGLCVWTFADGRNKEHWVCLWSLRWHRAGKDSSLF